MTLPINAFLGQPLAQQRSGTDRDKKACIQDVKRFCHNLMNDKDLAIVACLKQTGLTTAGLRVLTDHGR